MLINIFKLVLVLFDRLGLMVELKMVISDSVVSSVMFDLLIYL